MYLLFDVDEITSYPENSLRKSKDALTAKSADNPSSPIKVPKLSQGWNGPSLSSLTLIFGWSIL